MSLRRRDSVRKDMLRKQRESWFETYCDVCRSEHVLEFSLPEHEWLCESCGEVVERVYGCLGCTRVLCASCVPRYGETSLDVICGDLGVTRERVRQIEGIALRKLRDRIPRMKEFEKVW